MTSESPSKVQSRHLRRGAYLYVRQSSLHQVVENTESTKRQYALRNRAVALGWPVEQIQVIDADQGLSGASASDRKGFQQLVKEVSLGNAGIVMGLEVSRLARNSSDWHRLLEICALTDTLILDEDGVYDPAHFNDRLLLGLKGTMSEAELHVLRARLRGGILSKARRGELRVPLPMGFVYDSEGAVHLHPDAQVREAIHELFRTFERVGSVSGTVRAFGKQGWRFPRRPRLGPRRGEVIWCDLQHTRALWILKNPRYAGAFCFGRTRQRKRPDGSHRFDRLPQEEWTSLLRDAHDAYISWEQFEANLLRIHENAQAHGADRKSGPAREGPALLQGLAICGLCGDRMTVRYHHRGSMLVPDYVCQKRAVERSEPVCQRIHGAGVDEAIGDLLLECVTPMALEVTLTVQQELEARASEVDRMLNQEVERARYEADRARRRYMAVDPDNRLVADTLESEWNHKLRAYSETQRRYEERRKTEPRELSSELRERVRALATDFPRAWKDPRTPHRDRKRLVRLLVADVTLRKADRVYVDVRFGGGATRSLTVPLAAPSWKLRQTPPEVVACVDRLLDDYTDAEIAQQLNADGYLSGQGKEFTPLAVWRIRRSYGLKDRYHRLRERGMLDQDELAKRLGVSPATIRVWRRHGLLRSHAYNDKKCRLFEIPEHPPVKNRRKFLEAARVSSTQSDG